MTCEWFRAKPRFDTEAGYSEMAYCSPPPTFRLSVQVTPYNVSPQDRFSGSTGGEDALSVTFDSYQDKKK